MSWPSLSLRWMLSRPTSVETMLGETGETTATRLVVAVAVAVVVVVAVVVAAVAAAVAVVVAVAAVVAAAVVAVAAVVEMLAVVVEEGEHWEASFDRTPPEEQEMFLKKMYHQSYQAVFK